MLVKGATGIDCPSVKIIVLGQKPLAGNAVFCNDVAPDV